MRSPGSSPGSEQHLKISPRQSSTASASPRGSSSRRLLLSRTSRTDCSLASERSLSHPPYPMHSPGSSPGSEQHLKLSPRQSPTASACPRGSSSRRLLLSQTSRTDCSLASERSPSLPPYPMHSPGSSPGSER